MKEEMPGVNVDLLEGSLAWRQHDGGHTDGPNVEYFIRWAEAQWSKETERADAARPVTDDAVPPAVRTEARR
jgi:hypothetical protein